MSRIDPTDERFITARRRLNVQLLRVHGIDAALVDRYGRRGGRRLTATAMRQRASSLLQHGTHPTYTKSAADARLRTLDDTEAVRS